jgi:hypothetical protein
MNRRELDRLAAFCQGMEAYCPLTDYKKLELKYMEITHLFYSEYDSLYHDIESFFSPHFILEYKQTRELNPRDYNVMIFAGKLTPFAHVKEFMNNLGIETEIKMHYSKKSYFSASGRQFEYNGMKLVYDKDNEVLYLVDNERKKIFLLSDDLDRLERAVSRVIRSTQKIIIENKANGIFFHASGCKINNKILLFIGSKGSGKTTLLLEGIIHENGSELSRDRVFLFLKDNCLKVRGWPNLYNIDGGTIKRFSRLEASVKQQRYMKLFQPASLPEQSKEIKYHFKGPDLLPNLDINTEGVPDFIIFPKISPGTKMNRIKPLTQARMKNLFLDNCFSPHDPNYINWHHYHDADITKITDNKNKLLDFFYRQKNIYEFDWNVNNQYPLRDLATFFSLPNIN